MSPSALSRFESRVARTDSCWLWTGKLQSLGYAVLRDDGRTQLAHRLSYEHFVGAIPAGLECDHVCRVRHCVNPSHLELVTHAENCRRSAAHARPPRPRGFSINRSRTHCRHGHELTPENSYVRPGTTTPRCRECHRKTVRDHAERYRSAGGGR